MKKTLRVLISILVLAGILEGINLYQKHLEMVKYVEPYCATKYQHNVDEYKACKVLSPVKILQNLKEKDTLVTEVINLPTLGM